MLLLHVAGRPDRTCVRDHTVVRIAVKSSSNRPEIQEKYGRSRKIINVEIMFPRFKNDRLHIHTLLRASPSHH